MTIMNYCVLKILNFISSYDVAYYSLESFNWNPKLKATIMIK